MNTSFLIISGCQADNSKWPSSPSCSGMERCTIWKTLGGESRLAMPFPVWARTQLPGSPRSQAPGEGPDSWSWDFLAVILVNHCPLSWWDWGEDLVLKWPGRTLTLAWESAVAFLLSPMTAFSRVLLYKPCLNSEISHFSKKPWFVLVRTGISQSQSGC